MNAPLSGRSFGRDLDLDADVVVIGSGAGGAVVAATLAEAGRRVVVLEEGPWIPGLQYGGFRISESVRHAWRDGAMTLAVGVGNSPSINVTSGRMVGGSSMLTGGVCFRIPDAVLDEWSRAHGLSDLSPAAMAPWFDAVEKDVHVETVLESMRSVGTRRFVEGGEKLGVAFHSMRRNTRGCNGCGRCNFGCPHGAKLSVDLTYLPRAVHAGAQVWSDCRVDRIVMDGDRATGVVGRLLDGPFGTAGRRLRVRAGQVVVAAGGIHSPGLLRRSGIGGRSGAVGRKLTLHPSFRMIARFDTPVRGWEGALQSAYSDHYEHDDGMLLNSVFVPTGVLAATMPGFGPHLVSRLQQIDHLAIFGGMLHDDPGGRVWPSPWREPFMTYRMSSRDRARVPVLLRRMAAIFFSAGAREVFVPVFGAPPMDADAFARFPLESVPGSRFEVSSQHPLGTCHMGPTSDAVVDPWGRTWDTANVFVADGSIMPTSLGVNPQIAIMSMALRIGSALRDGRGRAR